MIKYIIFVLILISGTADAARSPVVWGNSATAQFLSPIVKALLGNGFALYPAKALVGDCSDGDVTISSGTTSLARDMYYNNLTINGTGVLSIQNQRVFVCGTLDITAAPAGAIFANGGNGGNGGATGTTGTAGVNAGAGTNLTGRTGGAGGAGTTGAGAQGGNGTAGNIISCVVGTSGSGSDSGAGGLGSSGAGGAKRAQVVCTAWPMRDIATWYTPQTGSGAALESGASGGGGGGGGGDGTNAGGGGGGGGASGQTVYISAGIIKTSVSTPAAVIQARGGGGGNGGSTTLGNTGGGGGGAGGSGGWAVIKWNARSGPTISGAISATGGAPGNGGTKTGTGVNGNNGGLSSPVQPGLIQTLDYSTGTITTSTSGSADL